MIGWFFNTKIGRWLAIAGAVLLGLLTLRFTWKRAGAREERREAQAKDRSNAESIRTRVDAADDGVHQPEDRIFRD